jgi:cytoskeleton protein RodZ
MLAPTPERFMAKLSAHSAFPANESVLDARLCAEIGSQLERAREARGLSLADIGEKLLLSVRQVRALETVDVAAFHNAVFQLNALRKYALLADLDPALVSKLSTALMLPDPESTTTRSGTYTAIAYDEPRRGLRAVASVVAMVAIAAVGFYALRARSLSGPATGLVVAAQVPAGLPASGDKELAASPAPPTDPAVEDTQTPPAQTSVTRMPAAFGTVRVAQPTWIFVRDADGAVIERNLAAGELLELETQPTYLAVGVSDPELVIGTAPIDVARFVANGQVRIRAGDFDALVQGASPIQAPTAAAGR